MAEMIRVNIGKEPKYIPAQNGKKQVAYVDVVENRRKLNTATNEWENADPRWYEARFDGRDADVIRDQFQKGDSLVVFGSTERFIRETAEGKVFRTTKLYVDGFGPDPRLTRFTIDRSQRQSQTAAPTQRVDQSTDLSEADLEIGEFQAFRSDVYERLSESVQQVQIAPDLATALMNQVDLSQGSPEAMFANIDEMLNRSGINIEVKNYLLSPVQAYAGKHTPTQAPVSPAGPAWPGANPWAPPQQSQQRMDLSHAPALGY